MIMFPKRVTNPEECPFRHEDQEWFGFECSLSTGKFDCDQGHVARVAKSIREPIEGVTLIDYASVRVFTFPSECPFSGRPTMPTVK